MYNNINELIDTLSTNGISEDRKKILSPLIDYIQEKNNQGKDIRINFICTHNSRRSHLSQVWTQAIASYYGIKDLYCYSGGTEATALFPMVAETLKNQGFHMKKLTEGNNPVFAIKYDDNSLPIIGFSKTYDDDFNPKASFAAVMTCSQADSGCPFIAGAEKRIPITFEDPKLFDNTPQQEEKYMERSLQIATELKYVLQSIK